MILAFATGYLGFVGLVSDMFRQVGAQSGEVKVQPKASGRLDLVEISGCSDGAPSALATGVARGGANGQMGPTGSVSASQDQR